MTEIDARELSCPLTRWGWARERMALNVAVAPPLQGDHICGNADPFFTFFGCVADPSLL
ncbi:hypothetical protein TSMEX_010388 [Taenia solium]|eukprot:TsM_000295800 transcript=TsM_000295800 gene=TsM_000295800